MDNMDILVLLQPQGDGIHPTSTAAISAALELGEGKSVCGLLLSDGRAATQTLRKSGLQRVYICTHPAFGLFRAEQHCAALLDCLRLLSPQSLLVGATPEGRTLAPMLAAALGTGVTADCTRLSYTEEGLLLQTRPAFGGDMMADIITPRARPQIATLRYSVTGGHELNGDTPLESIPADFSGLNTQLPQAEWADKTTTSQVCEDIVVALGGGFTDKGQLQPFIEYTHSIGGRLMCSRALVERGWFGRDCQIGLSGQSVSPRLLFTFGVSGSVQFMAGAAGAQRICAVNLDETAPIMLQADLPITGDMHEIINVLINQY